MTDMSAKMGWLVQHIDKAEMVGVESFTKGESIDMATVEFEMSLFFVEKGFQKIPQRDDSEYVEVGVFYKIFVLVNDSTFTPKADSMILDEKDFIERFVLGGFGEDIRLSHIHKVDMAVLESKEYITDFEEEGGEGEGFELNFSVVERYETMEEYSDVWDEKPAYPCPVSGCEESVEEGEVREHCLDKHGFWEESYGGAVKQ